MDRLLWPLQLVKMVFIVVQWENEDTVSVVNEKQVVGNGELQEGTDTWKYRPVQTKEGSPF